MRLFSIQLRAVGNGGKIPGQGFVQAHAQALIQQRFARRADL